jgi:hypothetical protein
MAWRVKALSGLHTGASLEQAQACLDQAMSCHDLGQARAERTYTAVVWAHALQQAGHAQAARHWADEARALADRHGYVLGRCEHGAAAVLDLPDRAGACGALP